MYTPSHFHELRTEAIHNLIRAHPLATIVTSSADGLDANHVPLHLLPEQGPFGTLRGHIARSNPMGCGSVPESEALVVFHGPDAYISPSWYPTKQEHGKAVPTWNYAVVHAYGALRRVDDAAWLRTHLQALTNLHEAAFPEPWAMTDAPHDYIDRLLGAIVGIEIVITRFSGKWKTSQNQPPRNRDGVVDGLKDLGGERASAMAALVAKHAGGER